MDRYTIIFNIECDSIRNKLAKIFTNMKSLKHNSIYCVHGILNNYIVQIKFDRVILKDVKFSDISKFIKELDKRNISLSVREYIGKRSLMNNDYYDVLEGIDSAGFCKIGRNRLDDCEIVCMFMKPSTYGTSYGILNKDEFIIFSNELWKIDRINNELINYHSDLSTKTHTNKIILTI